MRGSGGHFAMSTYNDHKAGRRFQIMWEDSVGKQVYLWYKGCKQV